MIDHNHPFEPLKINLFVLILIVLVLACLLFVIPAKGAVHTWTCSEVQGKDISPYWFLTVDGKVYPDRFQTLDACLKEVRKDIKRKAKAEKAKSEHLPSKH